MILKINAKLKMSLLAILLTLSVGIIIYSNTFQVPFALDDEASIVNNIVVKSLDNVFYAYQLGMKSVQNRILVYLTFALNYQYGGLNVSGYHVVNLLIHLVSALLVYALLRLTFRTPYFRGTSLGSDSQSCLATAVPLLRSPQCFIPLFGALLFVAHPVQTQAVTYIVQRMASLTTMFYLLSVVLYVMARLRISEAEFMMQHQGSKTGSLLTSRIPLVVCFAGSVLAAVLAMKAKEIAFTLPLAIVLYEICFFQCSWKKRLLYLLPLLATLPIIPLTVLGFLDVGTDAQTATELPPSQSEQLLIGTPFSRPVYLFTQFRVIVTYLRLMFFPVNQNLDYDYLVFNTFFTPQVYLSFVLLTIIFAFAVYLLVISRRTSDSPGKAVLPALRLIAFGIMWFFLTLSVESSLIPIKDLIMEHRLYLPFFGAATAFAMAFFLLWERLAGPSGGILLLMSSVALVLLLGVMTYQRNHVWADPIRLWQDVVSKSPYKARPVNNLGVALEKAGKRAEAVKAFSRAIKLDPAYSKAYYNLADLHLVNNQPEKSLPLLQTAIGLNPDFSEAYVAAGAALMRSGRFSDVVSFLERYPEIVGGNAEARFYLGASYAFVGNRAAAQRELKILSRLDPQLAANLRSMLR